MRSPLAIIGMSPGNSYFKDYEIRFLLREAVERFGRCAIMVADIPAIATYMALGYPANRARSKAIPKGNNLRNRTRRLAEELGYSEDVVRIVDWAEEIDAHPEYQRHYEAICEKYRTLPAFAEGVRATSCAVLEDSGKFTGDLASATEGATHYLLSELAFMEFAPEFFGCPRVCYLYHRNWPIFEKYISGFYDGRSRDYLDFLLLEAPYETYAKLNDQEVALGVALHDTYSRVMQSGILRASFVDYPPAIQRKGAEFSGIFHTIITGFAERHQLRIEWVEETGYGAVIAGLEEGRFDIFCSPTWPTPERHCKATLCFPAYYSDVGVWVREDSPLVGQDWLTLNDPQYQIAITENDITHAICLTDFTRAKWVRVPQLGRVKALLDAVAEGRATATMVENLTYDAYARDLPCKLVNIAEDKPIRRYSNSFLIGKHQNDFAEVLDNYMIDLNRRGAIRACVDRFAVSSKGLTFSPMLSRGL